MFESASSLILKVFFSVLLPNVHISNLVPLDKTGAVSSCIVIEDFTTTHLKHFNLHAYVITFYGDTIMHILRVHFTVRTSLGLLKASEPK